jgi:hypothetical protein
MHHWRKIRPIPDTVRSTVCAFRLSAIALLGLKVPATSRDDPGSAGGVQGRQRVIGF